MTPVSLRQWRSQDAAAIAEMVQDPHVRRWSSLPELGAERWITQQRDAERGPSLAICAAR